MSNELTNPKNYIAPKGFNLAEAMAEEMAGMEVRFDRIKMPIGGVTVFEVPGEAPGETDVVKEFCGVILYQHPLFSYYSKGYTGGNDRPDCGSFDGITGVGDPGGNCATCPLNQFGSGKNGGKACKNKRRIYILREGESIPVLITIPNSSVTDFGMYVKRLLAKGRKSNSVVTRFSLKKAENAGRVEYTKAQFAVSRPLTDEEHTYVESIAEHMKQLAARVPFEDEPDPDASMVIDPETGEILES